MDGRSGGDTQAAVTTLKVLPFVVSRAIERLMVLDAVLGESETSWLATEPDKLAHFTLIPGIRREELPQLVFLNDTSQTFDIFPTS
jgi:hypothetical protein